MSDRFPGDDIEIWLSQYERDNLLALLQAVAQISGPLQRMGNNGDWNMQILYKLGQEGNKTDWGHPNRSAEKMAEDYSRYVCPEPKCEWPQKRIV